MCRTFTLTFTFWKRAKYWTMETVVHRLNQQQSLLRPSPHSSNDGIRSPHDRQQLDTTDKDLQQWLEGRHVIVITLIVTFVGIIIALLLVASHRIVSYRIASYRIVSYRIVSYRIVSHHIVSLRIASYRIVSYRIVSYRITSYRIVSYRFVSYRVASHRIVSYNIVSYRIVSYRIASHRIVSYRIASHRIASYHIVSYRFISHRIVSYCIVSYRIVSYRIVSYRIVSYRVVLLCILFPRLDYCGIVIGLVGSFVPWIYFCFYCSFVSKVVHTVVILSLGLACFVVSMMGKFAEPKYRPIRSSMYISDIYWIGLMRTFF